jgi:UDP-glucose:(heptosyl)LPS alpha-1,3-glucosyltransferase
MNIGFATFRYYPYGGLEKSMRNIALEVLRRGHDLTLYCHCWEGDPLPGARLEILPAKGWTNHGKMLSFVRNFRQRNLPHNHDLIVGFKRMPGLDLYYNGDVCYQNEAASKTPSLHRFTPRYKILSAFEKAVFSGESSTHIMYIADREKRIFQNFYGTAECRFHALPPGIDKEAIRRVCLPGQRRHLRRQMGVEEDTFIALMVGSDFYRKGVDRSIRALSALPRDAGKGAELWIAGKGDPAPFKKLANRSGVEHRVRFLGARKDVPELLAAADVLLHPALSETAGNAILEGMVAGLPIVVSNSAGFSFHVDKAGGGMLVRDDPWCQADFDRALVTLFGDGALRRELGEAGWRYADKTDLYNRPRVAADIIEALGQQKYGSGVRSKVAV